jgi:L,D-transpeptidase ErfK/SrfK
MPGVLLAALWLAGCAGMSGDVTVDGSDADEAVLLAELEEVPPIQGGRFTLAPGQDVVGELQVIRARFEDTFVDIARTYGLGYADLIAANPDVDPWLPGADTPILLPTHYVLPNAPRAGLVLNIAARRLFYYPEAAAGEQAVVETYPIGIGRTGWATPTGETVVTSKARDPVWYVPAAVRQEHLLQGDPLPKQVPPGPDNPLGRHVLALDLPGYLIHGTNKPAGVGMRVSHGCVRLFPEDIASLYPRIAVGTQVRIVNQPFLFGWDAGELYLEAHPPLAEDPRDWPVTLVAQARAALVDFSGDPVDLAEDRIDTIGLEMLGFPVSIVSGSAAGTFRSARPVLNIVKHDRVADQTAD